MNHTAGAESNLNHISKAAYSKVAPCVIRILLVLCVLTRSHPGKKMSRSSELSDSSIINSCKPRGTLSIDVYDVYPACRLLLANMLPAAAHLKVRLTYVKHLKNTEVQYCRTTILGQSSGCNSQYRDGGTTSYN